ncbi:glutaredoxin family protein [Bermanella sp. WJH001]|uniref:glutaredoxin family protein n=1 Tax=Bermanella sp. WJH001 TaxID=3048005 RepID=UPI0024BEDF17|nr:glutaredoxin domain-containing protein [Bermanella sp. WJH001]MDJ1537573.1 glutathione S-transferase N-terminal domain-containing protein [Bermanella sp. WJH001]
MSSYALYYYDQCPFCQMVLREMHNLPLKVELKNTLKDPQNRQDLIQGGGRSTVPCLRITDESNQVQWMYESRDIVQYLKQQAK